MTEQNQFQDFDKKYLGYQGKYYPADMKFQIRGAGVREIRRWANLDENDPRNLAESVIDIISNCVRVLSISGENTYTYKDIYEHDKIAFLIAVQSISFADDERRLMVSGKCTGPGSCGKVFDKLVVQLGNLEYSPIDSKYDKYFDANEGMFKFTTKNFGTIDYKFSTIGLGTVMMAWIMTFSPTFIEKNKNMFRMVQACVTDNRGLTTDMLRKIQVEDYNTWSAEKLAFMTQLVDKMNDDILKTLRYQCPDCGAVFHTRMEFLGGYKTMFMPVQSIDDELV